MHQAYVQQDSVSSFEQVADTYIAETLEAIEEVHSLSIVVVRGDEIVYTRSFGMADPETGLKSTPETNYYIASSTKSFTALATTLLAEQGLIDLDAPITHYLTEVSFDTALHADQIRIRDLLTHTSGLANDPIAIRSAYSGEHTPAVLRQLLSASKPNRAGYGNFAYTNVGYNILSLILEQVTHKPWQILLDELVFEPLGMHQTSAYISEAVDKHWPMAAPYYGLGWTGIERVSLQKQDRTMHAAGGTISTAQDIAQWLKVQINEGRLDGRQVFPVSIIQETQRKQAEADQNFYRFHRHGYGLGWYVSDYDDEVMIHHFGGFPGFRAHVSFLPEHDLGVAVLVNDSSRPGFILADMMATFAYDWWLGKDQVIEQYVGQRTTFLEQLEQGKARLAAGRAEMAKRTWQLTEPLESYTGTYYSPAFGTVYVYIDHSGVLAVRNGYMFAVSTPYTKPNTIRVEMVPYSGDVMAFKVENGQVDELVFNGNTFKRL